MAERRFHGWQAIAAIVGSLATLVTAVVAAAAFLRDDGARPPTVRPTNVSTGATDRASAPAEEPAAAPEEPLHDKLRLRLGLQIEFDTNPPDANPSGGDPELYRAGGSDANKITGYYGAALWTANINPTRSQCDLELTTQGTREPIVVDVGSRLCVRTSSGRIVLVRFIKQMAGGDWQIEATVWRA